MPTVLRTFIYGLSLPVAISTAFSAAEARTLGSDDLRAAGGHQMRGGQGQQMQSPASILTKWPRMPICCQSYRWLVPSQGLSHPAVQGMIMSQAGTTI